MLIFMPFFVAGKLAAVFISYEKGTAVFISYE